MSARKGAVQRALEDELRELAKRDAALSAGVLAASALALTRELDNPKVSATAKSMCARALREQLDRMWELAPAEEEKDGLDDLAAQRRKRIAERARRAAAADSSRS